MTWDYLSTIVDSRDIPTSEEGCSEHDLVRLNSSTILMVCRTDGGDGEETHKSMNYVRTVSTDEGKTWSYPRFINAGSARPRLLATTTSAGKEAILMIGGRWGSPCDSGAQGGYPGRCCAPPCDWRTANRSMEPMLFVDGSGSEGVSWQASS